MSKFIVCAFIAKQIAQLDEILIKSIEIYEIFIELPSKIIRFFHEPRLESS